MGKIGIQIIAGQLGLGGAERQIYYLARGLDRQRFEVRVFNLSDGGGYYWARRIAEMDIAVVEISSQNRLKRLWDITQMIREWRPHIIHAFPYHVNGYAVLAGSLNSIPAVGSIRNLPNERHLNRVPRIWRQLCLFGVTKLVCNSCSAQEMLSEKFPTLDAPVVIRNGVSVPPEKEIVRLRTAALEEVGLADDRLTVGYVGRLSYQKNVPILLESISKLLLDLTTLELIIVGDGPLRGELERQVSRLGLRDTVRFIGARPLAEEVMPAFDVLCLPSHFEGMPNVLMEAGAAGIPVVASEVGDVPKIVEHERTGLLFDPGDVTQMTTYLKTLLTNKELRNQMGKAARKRMHLEFSIRKMVEAYEQLYEHLSATNG